MLRDKIDNNYCTSVAIFDFLCNLMYYFDHLYIEIYAHLKII